MSKEKEQPFDDSNINDLARDIIKKELLAKVAKRLNENDPAVMSTLKTLINESDKPKDNQDAKWLGGNP